MKKLLVIGHIWPEPKTTAAGNRMKQLLEAFLACNFEITFSSTATRTEYSENLADLGIREVGIHLNDPSFDSFISELKPNVVIFDRFMVEEQFGWRVSDNCPKCLRILNTEDLHSLREFRQFCFKKGEEWSNPKWLQQDKTKRELASIYRSDLTLVVSSFEEDLLTDVVGIKKGLVMHLPFLLDKVDGHQQSKWPDFQERIDFISFGNGKHAPNVDSFKFLHTEIWPLIRKELPEANLHIYGAYLPQQIVEMHNPNHGFMVHGWVNDLATEIQKSRVVLAPLRFGAGIKGKLTAAMQNGTPSITTEIGAEGMRDSLPWAGLMADSPQQIAKAAIALHTNILEWETAQKNGVGIVNSIYNKKQLFEGLLSRMEELIENLDHHRTHNIIGSLLQHQSMAATKFMGKWIEEKNKSS